MNVILRPLPLAGMHGELQGDKRQYLPFALVWDCPCGSHQEQDLRTQYLSYPPVGEPFEHVLYCNACERESKVSLRFGYVLELVSRG